ncbi:MAG: ribonuclease P protein component [Candidatus Tyloplasma litorale]|nr:MAG: ribonuclease P protein component [Mycoplasmatales bacterium]
MKKQYSLKSKIQFNKILKNGKKIKSKYFLISYQKNNEFKIGISIPKRLGNAVFRNYNKRVIKNIISKINVYDKKFLIVIVARKSFIELKELSDKERILKQEINKIKN